MKFIKYIYIGLIAASSLSIGGCSADFLDTIPTDAVSDQTIANTLDGVYLALNGIHRKMVSQDLSIQGMGGEPGFMFSREAHADDYTWASNTWIKTHHTWAINTNEASSYNRGIWQTYYQFILNANKILEALDIVEINGSSEQSLANAYRGEALCIRAWAHFNLVQYYAKPYIYGSENSDLGIPYRTSSSTENMARHTLKQVYEYINSDLENAVNLLQGYKAYDITHYSRKVALGLRARVSLTQQDYVAAADFASKAIEEAENDGRRIMQADELFCGFADISTDTRDAMYAARTLDDQTVYFYSFYAYMSWNFNASAIRVGVKCISQTTYDLMSETDIRRGWWDATGEAEVPSSSYSKLPYQNRKFTARSTSDAVGDVAFMRLSEIYLIACEAYARAGNTAKAKEYFSIYIAQRDPEYVDLGNTGSAFAEEIMNHRRIELWGEGFRWFDLKRLQLPCYRTGSNFDVSFCGFLKKEITDNGWYYEIPDSETNYNSLMVKNYGTSD